MRNAQSAKKRGRAKGGGRRGQEWHARLSKKTAGPGAHRPKSAPDPGRRPKADVERTQNHGPAHPARMQRHTPLPGPGEDAGRNRNTGPHRSTAGGEGPEWRGAEDTKRPGTKAPDERKPSRAPPCPLPTPSRPSRTPGQCGGCVLTIHKNCRGYAFKHKEKSNFAKSGWQITPPESFCYGKW